jgi:predicted component of type VI protein secretion system
MPAQLVSLTEGPSILLDKPILLLGRHPECDIQIDSRKISRRHCCIAQVGDYLVVRDLGSTNGIRINGARVLEGKLRTDDELTIGGFRYKVAWDSLGPPSPRPGAQTPVAKREAKRGLPARGVDDDMLEECDEPVALADSISMPPPTHRRPDLPSAEKADSSEEVEIDATAPPPRPDSARKMIVPENIDLAPVSDMDLPHIEPPSNHQQ